MAASKRAISKKSELTALLGDPDIHYDDALTRALRALVFGWAEPGGTGKPAVYAILSQIEVLAESLAAMDNLLQDKNLVINIALKQLRLSYAVHRKARQDGAS
jgi:hypothetical protein